MSVHALWRECYAAWAGQQRKHCGGESHLREKRMRAIEECAARNDTGTASKCLPQVARVLEGAYCKLGITGEV
jgi:hypothetical protein